MRTLFLIASTSLVQVNSFAGWTMPIPSRPGCCLLAKKQTATLVEEEAPAGIAGAEFFGGNKQKEEFYDEESEVAAVQSETAISSGFVDRFVTKQAQGNSTVTLPSAAFDTLAVAQLAYSLQSQINEALYEWAPAANTDLSYDETRLQWTTPLSRTAATPLLELLSALDFYPQLDVAIASGRQLSDNSFELNWEISVQWPTLWAPRVLLLGASQLQTDASGRRIVSQTDTVFGKDMLNNIGSQLVPRFWDWYHVGMTPTAELMPRLNVQTPPFSNGLQIFEIPSRWVTTPSMVEVGSREDGNAQMIPNHAFSCIIKTMGPNRQRYTPTSPVQVQIVNSDDKQTLEWSIPLSVEFLTNPRLPLPGPDSEALPDCDPQCSYQFAPRRKVATLPFGGNPQDPGIRDARQQLYERVLAKEGLKPKLDDAGRPRFFFWQNIAKACYTEEGLGMCVYEWRPEFGKANEVGIELEL